MREEEDTMSRSPYWLLVGLVLVALVLSGCGAAAPLPMPPVAATAPPMQPLAPAFGEGAGPAAERSALDATSSNLPDVSQRLIVRTANLSIVVKDTSEAIRQISALATQMGGFVVTSQTSKVDQAMRGSITIRVPAERFDDALRQIEALATDVPNRDIRGEDVTEQYVDLQARLRNLEATEAQLQRIMERAEKIEDVLNVYRQLSETRGEIEQVKGRIQFLEQAAALSSITVALIPDELAQPIAIGGWRPTGTARSAIQALVRTLQGLADIAIWLALYVLPVLVMLAVPVVVIVLVVRRLRRRARPVTA